MKTTAYFALAMLLADTIFQIGVDLVRSEQLPITIIAVIAIPVLAFTLAATLRELGHSIRTELRVAS